jgi:hypothetical protein
VLVTYGLTGQIYQRTIDETWQQAFAKPPQNITLPGPGEGRRWGESVCFGLDGVSVYLTSEKKPCPLIVLRPVLVAANTQPPDIPTGGRDSDVPATHSNTRDLNRLDSSRK